MATKMYKGTSFKMVRGMDAKQHLEDGWTFEPSKKTTRKARAKLRPKPVEIITDPAGPEDLITTNEE